MRKPPGREITIKPTVELPEFRPEDAQLSRIDGYTTHNYSRTLYVLTYTPFEKPTQTILRTGDFDLYSQTVKLMIELRRKAGRRKAAVA